MEGDVAKTSANELTLTMGSVIGNIKETQEDGNISDVCPSSSSDAHPELTSDKTIDESITSTSNVGDEVDFQSSSTPLKTIKSDIDNEAEMFANDCNLSYVSNEKITEDVDDIVTDLENLLEETSQDFSLPINIKSKTNVLDEVNISDEKFSDDLLNNSLENLDLINPQLTLDSEKKVVDTGNHSEDVANAKNELEAETSVHVEADSQIDECSTKETCETDESKHVNDTPAPTETITENVEEHTDIKDENKQSEDVEENKQATNVIEHETIKTDEIVHETAANVENTETANTMEVEEEAKPSKVLPEEASDSNTEAIPESQADLAPQADADNIPDVEINRDEMNKIDCAMNLEEGSVDIKISESSDVNLVGDLKSDETPEVELAQDEAASTEPIIENAAEELQPPAPEIEESDTEGNDDNLADAIVAESQEDTVEDNKQITENVDLQSTEIEESQNAKNVELQSTEIVESESTENIENVESLTTDKVEINEPAMEVDEDNTIEPQLPVDSEVEKQVPATIEPEPMEVDDVEVKPAESSQPQPGECKESDEAVTREPEVCNDQQPEKASAATEINEPLQEAIEEQIDQPVELVQQPDVDEDDALVKAAQEASSFSDKVVEQPFAEVTSNVEAPVEEASDEQALIQAAQESQQRQEEASSQFSMQQFNQEEYNKPLNIFVDNIQPSQSIIKEAESTTNDEYEAVATKETSSDDDKQAEYSSKMSQNEDLKMTIRKNKADEAVSSILKIYDPKEPAQLEISPSESETDPEETPIPKLIIKQSQCSPKIHSPLKITIKPVLKPEEHVQQKSSPKIIIKPIVNPEDEAKSEESQRHHSPKITIKPIPKPSEEAERSHSPKITIKPIIKPTEASMSPKIKIKPIPKPEDIKEEVEEERIVLKINKSNIAQKDTPKKSDENEKLPKMKLKFSKEGGHAHIVNEQETNLRRPREDDTLAEELIDAKRAKLDVADEANSQQQAESEAKTTQESNIAPPPPVVLEPPVITPPAPRKRGRPRKVPLEVREGLKDLPKEEEIVIEENTETPSTRPKRSCRGPSVRTTLGIKPRKPRGAGRARGGRGRGRGAKAEDQTPKEKLSESKLKLIKEAALTAQINKSLTTQDVQMKLIDNQQHGLLTEDSSDLVLEREVSFDEQHQPEPPVIEDIKPEILIKHEELIIKDEIYDSQCERTDVVMYEEETRMSADINNSRAQTPAKQVFSQVGGDVVEESQSSVHSTATSESVKVRKGSRLEVFQEPEGSVISADQLAEYYWGGGGPFMLQEQVAQFLGIKSFKRKYPGMQRRAVDMQERDFIRESGLASEHMCDLGLTAVNTADILDIMYSDFQPKYEEYCKHQRDRQTKDITNKQKALSLAASQEKNKLDFMQQAMESASQWNANFNKTRREERKACMDLQTFTINFPKGRCKQINKPKIGHYPIALVPGQYTDYYKTFTPTELNNLPLNTMLYNPINVHHEDDSQSDGSASDSDSSSSGSDSSDSDSSDDDCNICVTPSSKKIAL